MSSRARFTSSAARAARRSRKASGYSRRWDSPTSATSTPPFSRAGRCTSGRIASALAMRPEVLLFDEATSALDPELVGEVLAVMKDLAREGRTMIVVTHEMKFAREAASRVVFLDDGRIVEIAPAEVFFEKPASERARQFLERYR